MCDSTTKETPRVYVACLASYNAGHLHGRWIDVDGDADDIQEQVRAMLRESPEPNVMVDCPECDGEGCDQCGDSGKVPSAEEWAIHDYEGFGSYSLSEWESFETVAQLAAMIEKHGLAYPAWVAHVGADFDDEEGFEEAYCGQWDSEKDYAEELFDECYAHDIPENLRFYIDYEAFSRDLFIGDNYSVDCPDGGVWVFRNC
ncbi:MAG: antirestriction protein ArdA [Planctomycetota bacterium]